MPIIGAVGQLRFDLKRHTLTYLESFYLNRHTLAYLESFYFKVRSKTRSTQKTIQISSVSEHKGYVARSSDVIEGNIYLDMNNISKEFSKPDYVAFKCVFLSVV